MVKNIIAKITSVFMIVFLLFSVIISLYFIIEEHNHDCSGEDCPVCQMIQMTEENLKTLDSSLLVYAVIILMFKSIIKTADNFKALVLDNSLIGEKVRINI